MGWRGQHRVLDRPGRGDHRRLHDPAPPVEHPPPALAVQTARVPSAGRLTSSTTTARNPTNSVGIMLHGMRRIAVVAVALLTAAACGTRLDEQAVRNAQAKSSVEQTG